MSIPARYRTWLVVVVDCLFPREEETFHSFNPRTFLHAHHKPGLCIREQMWWKSLPWCSPGSRQWVAWPRQWVAWSPEVPLSLGGDSHPPSVSVHAEPSGIWSDQKGWSHPSFARRRLSCSPPCWVYPWAPCGCKEFIGPSSYLLTGKTIRGQTPHRVPRQGPPFWEPIRLAHPAPCLKAGLRVLSPHPSFPISIECSLVPL